MAYIGALPKSQSFAIDTFTGNGVTTDYTLREAPASTAAILVFVGGVRQATDAYTLSGNTLSFTEAPPNSSSIQVLFLGLGATAAIPADGTVTSVKVANNAITTAKLATTGVSSGNYGSTNQIPVVTVGADGRVTYAANVSISIPAAYSTANAIPTMLMLSGM